MINSFFFEVRDSIIEKFKNIEKPIIAIDGVDGSGKTYFANNLLAAFKKEKINVIKISIDNFHFSKKYRYQKGKESAQGFYYDSYDYGAFIDECLTPFKKIENKILTKLYDVDLEQEDKRFESSSDILIIEGLFLHRKELVDFWDFSIFLDVSFDVSLERNILRSKKENKNTNIEDLKNRYFKRYKPGQEIYLNKENPKSKATIVIDNNDYLIPILSTHF